jgi:hypothetical protein
VSNQALLASGYLIVYRFHTAEQAWETIKRLDGLFLPYCDSGVRPNDFSISVFDCLQSIEIAVKNRWFSTLFDA